jgi:hypothetical protein
MPTNIFQQACDEFRRQFLGAMLAATHGNRTRAARALGMQRTYLLCCVRELGAEAPPSRAGTPAPAPTLPDSITATVEISTGAVRAGRACLRLRFLRHPSQQERDCLARDAERLPHLGLARRERLPRIAIPPRVLRQGCRASEVRLELRIELDALASELPEVVGLSERAVVPGEKTFERLLDGLLAMKGRVAEEGRCRGEVDLGSTKVFLRTREPRPCVCDADGIKRNR